MTKQAARKRFTPKDLATPGALDPDQGFSRFTLKARNVVIAAQNEAHAAGNAEIGTPHLLLGLVTDPDSVATKVINQQRVTLDAVRAAATAALPPSVPDAPDLVPYDAAARKVLELTFREALRLGHNYVGTEHLLLALIEQEDDRGILTRLGVDRAKTETAIVAALRRSRPRT